MQQFFTNIYPYLISSSFHSNEYVCHPCQSPPCLSLTKYKEQFENTKLVIRRRNKNKGRHCNGQKKKNKRLKHDIQNIIQKIIFKQREPHQRPVVKSGGREGYNSSYSTCGTRRVTLVTKLAMSYK